MLNCDLKCKKHKSLYNQAASIKLQVLISFLCFASAASGDNLPRQPPRIIPSKSIYNRNEVWLCAASRGNTWKHVETCTRLWWLIVSSFFRQMAFPPSSCRLFTCCSLCNQRDAWGCLTWLDCYLACYYSLPGSLSLSALLWAASHRAMVA